MNGIVDDSQKPQPKPGPQATVSLERILVEFPPGCWDEPSHALVMADGRTLRDHRIDQLALMIAGSLRQLLAKRPTASSLVDVDGRALVAPAPAPAADTLDT